MNFIILADKHKKGMKSKGCVGLIKANNKQNIFQKQYTTIKSHSEKHKIIYITGFEHDKFNNFISNEKKKFSVDIIHNKNYATRGSFFSLSLAKSFLNENCLVLGGQTTVTKSLIARATKNKLSTIFLGNTNTRIGCLEQPKYIGVDFDQGIHDIYYFKKNTCHKILPFMIEKNNAVFIFEIINSLIDSGEEFIYQKNRKNQICYHQ